MANGVIEQLLDFNQGNLYPKIADVNKSYVSENDVNGAVGFIKDLFTAQALDASTFEISGNKLSLKSDAVIPGTIENASSANKVKYALIIKTAENVETGYNGSQAVNINKVYQADKLTNNFRIKVPSGNTSTYKMVGESYDVEQVYSAKVADSLKNNFRIKVPSGDTADYKIVGELYDVDQVYSSKLADTAEKVSGSLKITYTDIAGTSQTLVNDWKGDGAVNANITGISEAKYARNLKTDSGNPIVGNDPKLSSILTVSKDGAIAALDASIGETATVLLSIKKDEDSYSYQWIDGTTVGGAQVDQADSDTSYYVLGASDKKQTTIYGNFNGKSPYFKNSNLYQTSDETLKTFTEDLDVNLDNLASIKKGLFYWNSDENKVLDIGVTAQSLEPLFPELVTETDGIKAVSYSKLSVVALAAIDKLYKRVKELEDEVEELKSK